MAAAQTAVVVKSLRTALDGLLDSMASGAKAGDEGERILGTIAEVLLEGESVGKASS